MRSRRSHQNPPMPGSDWGSSAGWWKSSKFRFSHRSWARPFQFRRSGWMSNGSELQNETPALSRLDQEPGPALQMVFRTSTGGNYFDAVDLGILDVACEFDEKFSIRDFDVHRFDVSFERPAGFLPHVKIFELLALHGERKHPLARSGDAVEGLGKMELHLI